ncbi:MAG: ribonuclease P protein component 1 [Nanoarchaeota archaeon]|nr:ribonuclease P protein component 1 [Nanoarchaeota archaeon]
MITPKNLIRHELIGLQVDVVESTNKDNIGISGVVINETKHMLTIKTTKGLKRIAKRCTIFAFKFSGKTVKVDGKRIEKKPEDRIKLKVKKW